MKLENLILFLAILFSSIHCFSQGEGEFIVELDRETGEYVKIGPVIPQVYLVYTGARAFNENSGTYIFASADAEYNVYSIDSEDGEVVSNPPMQNVTKFEYHHGQNLLYGLQETNIRKFVSIDPNNGLVTQIGNSMLPVGGYPGKYTLDESSGMFIMTDIPNNLKSISIWSGAVVYSPDLIIEQDENLVNLTFDHSTGVLYGLLQDNFPLKVYLVTIDRVTGSVEKIGDGTFLNGYTGQGTIDEANQQYIGVHYQGAEGHIITTFSLSSGEVLFQENIDCGTWDNIIHVEFDNVNGKLYAMHWDANIEANSVIDQDLEGVLKIYPNPTSGKITLEIADCDLEKIRIYNTLGQDMTSNTEVGCDGKKRVKIDLSRVEKGMYYVKTSSTASKVFKE